MDSLGLMLHCGLGSLLGTSGTTGASGTPGASEENNGLHYFDGITFNFLFPKKANIKQRRNFC